MHATLRGSDHFPDPVFPLSVKRHRVDADIALHGHDFTELVVVVAGSSVHAVARGRRVAERRVAPGDVFVLAPGERHGYRPGRGFAVYNVLFTPGLIAPDAVALHAVPGLADLLGTEPLFRGEGAAPTLRLDPVARGAVEEAMAAAAAEVAGRQPGWQVAARGAFHRLLVLLARGWTGAGGRPAGLAEAQDAAVAEAVAFMEANHAEEDLAVGDVAAVAGLSPHWFSEVFARRTGMSPWQWLTAVRIERAKRLLAEGRLPVTRIALDVGFSDSSYFARAFRRATGRSPRDWRGPAS